MTTIKAHFDGRVFVPEQPVDLPAGCEVEIALPSVSAPSSSKSTLAKLAEIAKQFPDDPNTPPDLAAQHDHYLYGTPKRP
jgi:predicted DNA-binding antitoxin AbrB/MazE fold protein